MKLSEALATAVSDHGVETVFGLMGNANLPFLSAWVARGGEYVKSVHEAGAVGMADGYARATGRLGLATVTFGPGVTNMLTALTEAVRARTPMVIVTGDYPAERNYRQQVDLAAAAGLAGAGLHRVLAAEHAIDDLATTAARAVMERRPILFVLPLEFSYVEVEYARSPYRPSSARPGLPDEAALDQALGLVASARRPIVLAGRGASGARAELLELAALIGAPVATTLLGRDLFRGDDFDLGIFGTLSHPVAVDQILKSDTVVAFGASLNQYTTSAGSLLAGRRVVHCDIDPIQLGRHAVVDVEILGDAATVARTMIDRLGAAGIGPPAGGSLRTEEVRAALAGRNPRDEFDDAAGDGTVDMRAAMIALDELLPADRLVATDGGRFQGPVWQYLGVSTPSDFTHTVHFASVGLGTGVGLGMSVAHRDRVTVVVAGDGGGAMSMMEFVTAVRYRLPFVLVLLNDGAYGAEYRHLVERGMDVGPSLLEWPDFAPVAEALGGYGVSARSLNDLAVVPERIAAGDLPLIVDIKCDPAAQLPWLHAAPRGQ